MYADSDRRAVKLTLKLKWLTIARIVSITLCIRTTSNMADILYKCMYSFIFSEICPHS